MQLNANPAVSPFASRQAAESSSASGSGSAGSNSASITASDFLELLVTEMRNQDPTANTDPNEYINQLVQVNSLQQLIQINQDLGGDSSATSSASPNLAPAAAPPRHRTQPSATGTLTGPAPRAAASRIAQALGPSAHSRVSSPAHLSASHPNPAR